MRTNSQHRTWTLAVVSLATAMLMLDIAVVNTAISDMGRDLHTGLDGLKWVVDAYTLALAAVVLTTGSGAAGFSQPDWSCSRSRRPLPPLPPTSRC